MSLAPCLVASHRISTRDKHNLPCLLAAKSVKRPPAPGSKSALVTLSPAPTPHAAHASPCSHNVLGWSDETSSATQLPKEDWCPDTWDPVVSTPLAAGSLQTLDLSYNGLQGARCAC